MLTVITIYEKWVYTTEIDFSLFSRLEAQET